MADIIVIKRDGSEEDFDTDKLSNSIMGAAMEVGGEDYELADELASTIEDMLEENDVEVIHSEDIQKFITKLLIEEGHASTAERYIIEADSRQRIRTMDNELMKHFEEITFKTEEESDIKRENANIDSSTAMGTMLKYGSEGAKSFNLLYLMSESISRAHKNGDIHIHDLDFLALTETCCQIPLDRLFKDGFNTGHGFLRQPGGIRTAGALSAIAIQSNQNDQHGGQSIPLFEYYLAPYVSLTFVKEIAHIWKLLYAAPTMTITDDKITQTETDYLLVHKQLKNKLCKYWEKHFRLVGADDYMDNHTLMDYEHLEEIKKLIKEFFKYRNIKIYKSRLNRIINLAYSETYSETFQSMEAFVHNLNTMHSRAGAQVPFSSINYGTDTSVEGRMVMNTLLDATLNGLGDGETCIFPIQIFKLKDGVNFKKKDPNYDIKKKVMKVSSKRLYPNFSNLDVDFNKAIYKEGHPETEVAYMGCRTRVATNIHDKNMEVIPGRGNLSFTSINLPRLALKADKNIDKFYDMLDNMMELVHRQLLERFELQCRKHPLNYPFLMGQGNWLGTEYLGPNDDIREALKHGTLTVGFIGLAETLTALTGKHHGESEESNKLGEEIIEHMRRFTDAWSEEEHMNYSVIGTPAEGLSGRFVRMDREIFGKIKGVTDKDYYTNSSHVPVSYPISAFKKIDIEAPYHAYENGGHILYIELDGDPSGNIKAFEKLVDYMHDKGAGYFAINHAVDRDPICGYVGIIKDKCPRCGRKEGEAMTMSMWRKIKGYANVGNADTLGVTGSASEENDRIANKL